MAKANQVSSPHAVSREQSWPDWERQFRELAGYTGGPEDLRLVLIPIRANETGEHWFLISRDSRTCQLFSDYVRGAALVLGYTGSKFISFWLNLIKEHNPDIFRPYSATLMENGKQVAYEGEILEGACQVSADYCLHLANEAFARQPQPSIQNEPQPRKPVRKYRSHLKKAIQLVLVEFDKASDLEVAKQLDHKEFEVPARWREAGTFVAVYRDPELRHAFEQTVSRVRRELRAKLSS